MVVQTKNKMKSLAKRFPELAEDWHPTLNGELTPFDVYPYSSISVWWKTKDGKEFQTPVRYKTTNYIKKDIYTVKPAKSSGKNKSKKDRKSLIKTNNIAIKHPDIAAEWDYEKNKGVKPQDVFEKSGKSFWFKCINGHSWQARIINRTAKKSRCPFCVMEEKKLVNTRPDIAEEFHSTKNKHINLFDLTASCKTKIWWKCKNCGKVYQETVVRRSSGHSCPKCNPPVKKPLPYEKSLEYNYPEIAKEWSSKLNRDLTPKDVRPMSGITVWWECSEDKEHPAWQSRIHNRTYNGNGCPTCHMENRKGVKL